MFSIIDEASIRMYPNKLQTVKTYCCLSTDTKPTTGITNGSQCLEMDTNKIYFFDQDNSTWLEFNGGGQ